jgi:hypothetical protein
MPRLITKDIAIKLFPNLEEIIANTEARYAFKLVNEQYLVHDNGNDILLYIKNDENGPLYEFSNSTDYIHYANKHDEEHAEYIDERIRPMFSKTERELAEREQFLCDNESKILSREDAELVFSTLKREIEKFKLNKRNLEFFMIASGQGSYELVIKVDNFDILFYLNRGDDTELEICRCSQEFINEFK